MNDFIIFEDWFTKKYKEKSDGRFWSFKVALNILHQRGGKNIVETGTTRMADDWGAGMATFLFGDYLKHYGGHLWTVDILPEAIEISKQVTEEFKDLTTYIVSDSLYFLTNFTEQIDLLYLDSLDCPIYDPPDSPTLLQAQNHQLEELKLAWNRLTPKSIILLDDNGFDNGGKAKLTKEFLRGEGWIELISHQQSLWIKEL